MGGTMVKTSELDDDDDDEERKVKGSRDGHIWDSGITSLIGHSQVGKTAALAIGIAGTCEIRITRIPPVVGSHEHVCVRESVIERDSEEIMECCSPKSG